ncbi:hypothetical protein [Aliiroseovarius sp. 2305UL8-7]|uniref:hypothetical protein n=1 Tax=Aliiroseovarius conchicola TaxID=3121637 RepID=UPI003529AF59
MKIVIIGGGGNAAEATGGFLLAKGYEVSFFRFSTRILVPGTPVRTTRLRSRLDRIEVKGTGDFSAYTFNGKVNWANEDDLRRADVFIYAMPSYLVEKVGEHLGKFIDGKVLINLSDRSLGTYNLVKSMKRYSYEAGPRLAIAFNGVPIMSQKHHREGDNSLFFVKPKLSFSVNKSELKHEAIQLLCDIFSLRASALKYYDSFLRLCMENVHSIEHAVADIVNLRYGNYDQPGRLYSSVNYTQAICRRISNIASERDRISLCLFGQSFVSLGAYDEVVFPSKFEEVAALSGSNKYRNEHEILKWAPSPDRISAFGYEDVGWAMVPLEQIGLLLGVESPALAALIDDWTTFCGTDFRAHGRKVTRTDLCHFGVLGPQVSA